MKLLKGYPGRSQGPLFRVTASNKDQFLEGCNWNPQLYLAVSHMVQTLVLQRKTGQNLMGP